MPQEPAFTEDQKQYLEGFIAGIARKSGISVPNEAAPPLFIITYKPILTSSLLLPKKYIFLIEDFIKD